MADLVYPGESAGGPINAGAMPSNYDVKIYQGDTFEFIMEIKDSFGVAVDLTGYTADGQLKTSYSDSSPIDFEVTITTPLAGVVNVYLAPAVTATLLPDTSYIYDLQLTEPGGDVRTYLTGDATIIPEVTKP